MLNIIVAILVEVLWGGFLILETIRNGLPTELAFWVAAAIQIAIGFLTYNAFKHYLVQRNIKVAIGWYYFSIMLMIIEMGVTFTLYYTVDSLKPAGGTWVIYILTVNSFYLYRIIRKEPISRQDASPGNRGEKLNKRKIRIILIK